MGWGLSHLSSQPPLPRWMLRAAVLLWVRMLYLTQGAQEWGTAVTHECHPPTLHTYPSGSIPGAGWRPVLQSAMDR